MGEKLLFTTRRRRRFTIVLPIIATTTTTAGVVVTGTGIEYVAASVVAAVVTAVVRVGALHVKSAVFTALAAFGAFFFVAYVFIAFGSHLAAVAAPVSASASAVVFVAVAKQIEVEVTTRFLHLAVIVGAEVVVLTGDEALGGVGGAIGPAYDRHKLDALALRRAHDAVFMFLQGFAGKGSGEMGGGGGGVVENQNDPASGFSSLRAALLRASPA